MFALEMMIEKLREDHRIKYGVDYSINRKYNQLHLMCHEVFLEKIVEEANYHNLSFETTHTYNT